MKGGKRLRKNKEKRDTSLLAKLILSLRALRERLKKFRLIHRISERQRALSYCSDGRYAEESRISYGFGVARVIAVFLLVLLLASSLIFGSGAVSYEKIYYMFKDIAYIKSYGEGTPHELSYSSPVRNQIYADFKNGLLVASDSELKIFNSTGRVTLSKGSDLTNPRVVCSDTSALIFDQGRSTYSIYNSFVKLYSEKTEYPISSADMAEDGSYLIVTSSKLFNSVVKIYDQNYTQCGEYRKNDIVISASMSKGGRYAAIVSLSVHSGKSIVQLDILDCKKSEVTAQFTLEGAMPYICEFLSDDRIALFTDDRFFIINKKAEALYEYSYPSDVEDIDINEDGFAILYSKTDLAGDRVLGVYNSNGNLTFSRRLEGNIRDIKLGKGCVYILKSDEILRIGTSLGNESSISSKSENLQIVVLGDGRAAVCSSNAATYISFDQIN